MKEYPEKLEKDMIIAFSKLMAYNCYTMNIYEYPIFLDDLNDFCKKYGMMNIFDRAINVTIKANDIISAFKAIEEELK